MSIKTGLFVARLVVLASTTILGRTWAAPTSGTLITLKVPGVTPSPRVMGKRVVMLSMTSDKTEVNLTPVVTVDG